MPVLTVVGRPRPEAGLRRSRHRGFTLIELIITLVLLGIIIAVGLPAFKSMVNNAQVRTVAEALQNGVRLARAEALRRNQQTVFSLTAGTPASGVTAVATGRNWSIQTIPLTGSTVESPEFIQGGALGDVASGVNIASAPAAICFNSNGRLSAPGATGQPGATCDAPATSVVYTVGKSGSDRALNVTVNIGGQVRMCDPQRTLAAATPDGC